jgi:hypothetical protein
MLSLTCVFMRVLWSYICWDVSLSVPYGSGTRAYRLQDKTRSRACIHTLPCLLQLWTSPPCQGGLWHCHTFYGAGPRLPAEVGSSAAVCPMASDPASWPGRILVLPRILRFPMGHGPQIYKESLGWPSYAARYACFQGATACFRGAWHLSHHGLQDMRACGTINACKMCGHAATVLRRLCWPHTRHNYSAGRPIRMVPCCWPCAIWQGDKTGHTHAAQGIIGYF